MSFCTNQGEIPYSTCSEDDALCTDPIGTGKNTILFIYLNQESSLGASAKVQFTDSSPRLVVLRLSGACEKNSECFPSVLLDNSGRSSSFITKNRKANIQHNLFNYQLRLLVASAGSLLNIESK